MFHLEKYGTLVMSVWEPFKSYQWWQRRINKYIFSIEDFSIIQLVFFIRKKMLLCHDSLACASSVRSLLIKVLPRLYPLFPRLPLSLRRSLPGIRCPNILLLLLLLSLLPFSRPMNLRKIICIYSLCSIDKLSFPSFSIFSFILKLPISSSVSQITKELCSSTS